MFDGNRWDLVAMKSAFYRRGNRVNVPYLSYEYPSESIRDRSIDTNKVELDRPLRQPIDLDMKFLQRRVISFLDEAREGNRIFLLYENGQDSRNYLRQGNVLENLCWTRLRCVQREFQRVFAGCKYLTASRKKSARDRRKKHYADAKLPRFPVLPARATVLAQRVATSILHCLPYYSKVSGWLSSRLEIRVSKTKVCFLSRCLIVVLVPVTGGLPLVLELNIQRHVRLITILIACSLVEWEKGGENR